jgi:hypothetical protein
MNELTRRSGLGYWAAILVWVLLLGVETIARGGTLRPVDEHHDVPWAFRVDLKREQLSSLRKLEQIDPKGVKAHSPEWLAVMAAMDAEIARVVAKLAKAHPHVRVSSVTGRKNPGFILRGSDKDARAMAAEPNVESLGPADEVIENLTMDPWE